MKLLITGSTGFIGRNLLLQALATEKWSEIITPARDPQKLRSLLSREGWIKLPPNLRILQSTPGHWGDDLTCDAVVHCAGVLFGRSHAEYHGVNVEGTLALLRKIPESAKVVLLSSQSAGGPTPKECKTRDEMTPDMPITHYGRSKKEMEAACLSNFKYRDLLILRLPMVLGARDQAILPLFHLAARKWRPKPGFLPKHYSFISVQDLCAAILRTLETETHTSTQQIYYVSHPQPISDCQLIECAGDLLGKKGRIVPLPHGFVRAAALLVDILPNMRRKIPSLTRDRVREIWPNHWVVDGSCFEKAFDCRCQIGLEASLSDALKWYRKMSLFNVC